MRTTSGKYHNWRNRIALSEHKELMATIESMIVNLQQIYKDSLTEVILYGSYARGTQTEESDIDIAVILLQKPSQEETCAMIDCVSSYELQCDTVLSVIDINKGMFEKWKNTLPSYKKIQKEGIVLWKAVA